MTDITELAQRVPERKRHDWSQSVMRDCDFCNQWSLTVKHEDGARICASCCDAEYTSKLEVANSALVEALEKAQQRIGELDNDCWTYENTVKNLLKRAGSAESSCSEAARILQSGERMALTRAINILLAAGTKVEAE